MQADLRARRLQALAGSLAIVALVLAENLVGRQINEVVLRMPGIDKAAHFAEYVLIVIALRWLVQLAGIAPRWTTLAATGAALVVASIDETMQRWGPARSVELADFAANLCGIAFGWAATSLAGTRRMVTVTLASVLAAYVTVDAHIRTRDMARGLLAERAHDFHQARLHYRNALDSGIRSAALYNSLSWVEIESGAGDPNEAAEFGRLALELRPGDADILDTYGWALHHAGRHHAALPLLEQAYALKPRMFCIHYHLGSVYLALGRRNEAEAHFRRQIELTGTREAAFARRALASMGAS